MSESESPARSVRLKDVLPELALEVRDFLQEEGEHDLARQVDGPRVTSTYGCGDEF